MIPHPIFSPDPHHVPSGTHMERSTMWNGKMHELNGDFQQQTVSSFTRGYHLFLASVDFPKHGWELSFPRTKWWLLVQFCFKKTKQKAAVWNMPRCCRFQCHRPRTCWTCPASLTSNLGGFFRAFPTRNGGLGVFPTRNGNLGVFPPEMDVSNGSSWQTHGKSTGISWEIHQK